jgi:hypothetical protein
LLNQINTSLHLKIYYEYIKELSSYLAYFIKKIPKTDQRQSDNNSFFPWKKIMANLDENLQKVYFPLFELKITKRIITLRSSQINIFINKFSAGFPVQVLHVNFICIIALMRVFYESRSSFIEWSNKHTFVMTKFHFTEFIQFFVCFV